MWFDARQRPDLVESVLVRRAAAEAGARLPRERPQDPDEHRRLEEPVVQLEARREVDQLERPALAAEDRSQHVRVLDVDLLDVRRIDALDGERASLVAVEERPEDEARVGSRPAHPLDGALLEERAVRAIPDDGEALAHGCSYSRKRRLYLPAIASKEWNLARHSGQHGLVIASNRLPIRLTLSDDGIEVAPSSGGLAVALQAVRGESSWVGWPGTVVPPDARAARPAASPA